MFEGAEPGHAHRERPDEPRHEGLHAAVLRCPFESQRIELSWPSARFRDEDATYLDLLSFLLGECESSRIVRRLREREGLVDRIDSSSYTPFDRGLFSINLDTLWRINTVDGSYVSLGSSWAGPTALTAVP